MLFIKTNMLRILFLSVLVIAFVQGSLYAQGDNKYEDVSQQDLSKKVSDISGKYYQGLTDRFRSNEQKISKKSARYLQKFQQQEKRLLEGLAKVNPEKGLENVAEQYQGFLQSLKNKSAKGDKLLSGEYLPTLDSLGTSLAFLKKMAGVGNKADQPLASLHLLRDKLDQSEKIRSFIAERKNQLRELLRTSTGLPPGLKKEYEKLNKTAYYYSAQINEYREALKDSKKAERKALSVLREIPAFQKFMKKNSQFAALFPQVENVDPSQALAGLQTRSSVQGLIRNRLSAGGPNANQVLQQNLAQAMAQLNALKDEINKLGGSGAGDIDMPDFKPNSQKTKSFLKRLEYSFDVQFDKSTRFFPSTANIGLGVGYKLNDKSIVGAGIAYKMGMGTIQHISLSHQGVGLRSFIDYKLKKSLFISGGYEMNYNATFKNIDQLKSYSAWQRSGLIGLSKRYNIGKKTSEMKFLWDFLSYQQVPRTQALVYRLGYKF